MEEPTHYWVLGGEKDSKKGMGLGACSVNLNQVEGGEVEKKT